MGHIHRHTADSSKLRERLGWEARIRFNAGIADTITWYRTHPDWLAAVFARTDAFLHQALALAEHHPRTAHSERGVQVSREND